MCLLLYHFSRRSRRSRGRRCRRDACGSSRLRGERVTDEHEESGEPHGSEAVAVETAHEVAVDPVALEASVHEVEVELLVGGGTRVHDAALRGGGCTRS